MAGIREVGNAIGRVANNAAKDVSGGVQKGGKLVYSSGKNTLAEIKKKMPTRGDVRRAAGDTVQTALASGKASASAAREGLASVRQAGGHASSAVGKAIAKPFNMAADAVGNTETGVILRSKMNDAKDQFRELKSDIRDTVKNNREARRIASVQADGACIQKKTDER
jgi:hypothetical protein